jgi:hypothetical protein
VRGRHAISACARIAQHWTGDGVLVIDLSAMKGIEIAPVSRTAWVESGVVAGELTRAASAHGLAVPFGDTGSVGAAGITLGGGVGWLARKYGMTIDSLLVAELVTADGRQLVASEDENPDLFWALRGGGGNFGIVTRLRYRLHPIGDVLHGDIVLPATRDILRRLVPALLAAPDDLTAMPYIASAPEEFSIPDQLRGALLLHLEVLWAGSPEEGERALAPLRALGPAVSDSVKLTPYPDVYPEHAPDPDAPPMGWAQRTVFIDAFDDAVIDIVERRLAESTTPWALVQLRVLGGASAGLPETPPRTLAGPHHPGLAHHPLHGSPRRGLARGLDGRFPGGPGAAWIGCLRQSHGG